MTKSMKRLVLGIAVVLTTGILGGCGSQENLGYVDSQKAITQSAKYKEVMAKLQERDANIQQRLATAQASQSAEEFQKTQTVAEQEFSLYRSALYKELQSYVESNVASIAKEKNLTIVVEKGAVTSGGIDITDELIKKMGTASDAQTENQKMDTAKSTESK